jgi:hypothetical protein
LKYKTKPPVVCIVVPLLRLTTYGLGVTAKLLGVRSSRKLQIAVAYGWHNQQCSAVPCSGSHHLSSVSRLTGVDNNGSMLYERLVAAAAAAAAAAATGSSGQHSLQQGSDRWTSQAACQTTLSASPYHGITSLPNT